MFRKEAEDDLRDAFAWYESRHERLGVAFLAEVERTVERIESFPDSHPTVFAPVRRALCRKFPYAIYFIPRRDGIVVLGVLHQRRRPLLWRERLA